MNRLLTIVSLFLVGIAFSMLFYSREKKELESEANPEEVPVTQMSINSAIPFSNVLENFINTGLSTQAGAINCLVVSRTDSTLILAGSQNGGVWISNNGARSWRPVNDTARSLCVTSIAQNNFRPNEFYYSTGVDIRENGFLLNDIYRSTDYGQTFSIVNALSTPNFGRVNKILPSPIDANTVYVLHNVPSQSKGELYRSTDNCSTFQMVYQATETIDNVIILPDGTVELSYDHSVYRSNTGNLGTFVQATGLPTTGYETNLAFCASQPNIQYCTVGQSPGYDFYKSLDTGKTWTYISHSSFGRRITVKPDDPDFLLGGWISPGVSIDGGLTWQQIIAGHDLRSFNFDPHRVGKVYVTSDFGVAKIEVDPITATSFNREYRADSLLYSQEAYFGDHGGSGIQSISGYQDLGSRFIQSMTLSRYMMAGDGEYCFISKQNPAIGYFTAFNGDIYRGDQMTTNNNAVAILNQLDGNNDGNVDDGTMLVQPFMMNNANDSQLYFPTFHWLWRSTDRGNNWMQVSRQTGNRYGDITIACTHKPNPIVYWTNSDSVFVMPNAATAAPFTEFGKPVPFDPGRCYVDPDNDSALYLLNRAYPSRISYCSNIFTGNTWTPISLAALTDITIQCMAVYPGNDQVILVGSKEGGLYVTTNRGLSWSKEVAMPNVQITEIKIRYNDKKVFIFTYGRGTWVADFAAPLAVASNESKATAKVYPNPFQDHCTIEFENDVSSQIELSDMNGKLWLKKACSGKTTTLNTESLAPGNYIITVKEGSKLIYKSKVIRI
jgi:hypothetical protein